MAFLPGFYCFTPSPYHNLADGLQGMEPLARRWQKSSFSRIDTTYFDAGT
jgi:hypothetical protein